MKSLSRRELYDLVWSEPMVKVSAQLGLSDVGLKKACKKHKIPTPGRGYWAKVTAGQKATKDAFPALASRDAHLEKLTFTPEAPTPRNQALRELRAEQKEVRSSQPRTLRALPPFEPVRTPHQLVRETARKLRGKPNEEGALLAQSDGCCGVRVSASTAERTIAFLDALVRELLRRKLSVRPAGYSTAVSNGVDTERFQITELSRLTPHIPTVEERQAYEKQQQRQRLSRTLATFDFSVGRPWPEKDRIWRGKLKVEITGYTENVRRSWSDGSTQTVEGLLRAIADGFEAALLDAEQRRQEQLERERRALRLQKRRALASSRRKRDEDRHSLLSELTKIAIKAQRLDAWIQTAEAAEGQDHLARMLAWAKGLQAELRHQLEPDGLNALLQERKLFPDPGCDPLCDPEGEPPPDPYASY